ncbi:ankyrin repeat domain-containing protein [Seongchinamella sediminis]|uniref:ankyrin repeat domain-containing protein n=1 Tax=Seongchinamella sediminis TaxID=2283635 RepID=UPI0013C359B4|nr:ankyrin repeat domain-containing protein [Seongchinamella sediminis]
MLFWLRGPALAASLMLWLATPGTAAGAPANCERSEDGGVDYYQSTYFREQLAGDFWRLESLASAGRALLPPQDLKQMAAEPAAAGERLMAAVDAHLCQPRPAHPELQWTTFLQSQHGGSGGRAWQTLSARQFIDGLPVDGGYCYAHFDREGQFLTVGCSLVARNDVALGEGEWPGEEEVVAVAEAAYIADLANLPGSGQKVESIERRYGGAQPFLLVRHVGCGVTRVNALTLEARYHCEEIRPMPVRSGLQDNEKLLLLEDLPPYFEDSAFVMDDSGGYLIAGSVQRAWQGETGPQIDRGTYLFSYSARGQLRWRRRLESASEGFWLYPREDAVLLWQRFSEPGGTDDRPYMRSVLLSLADGRPLEAERRFPLPFYGEVQPDALGTRLFALRTSGAQNALLALDRDGAVLWQSALGDSSLGRQAWPRPGGGLAALYVAGRDASYYSLRLITADGTIEHEVDLDLERGETVELLRVTDGHAELRVQVSATDARGHYELQSYLVDSGERVRRRIMPGVNPEQQRLLPNGQVLYFGGEGGWALLGEEGPAATWRRYLGLGESSSFTHAALADGELALLAYIDYPRERSTTPDRRAILRLDRAAAAQGTRADDCPLVTHAELRQLELNLWQDYNLTFSMPHQQRRPDPGCIDRHRIRYRDFMAALREDLHRRGYRAPGYFATVALESGQPGIHLRGGGAGRSQYGPGQLAYYLRAEFGDADELAAFLQIVLEPHARRTTALRDAFFLHTGVTLGLGIPPQAGGDVLDAYEARLARVLSEVTTRPVLDYLPTVEVGPPLLTLDSRGLSFAENPRTYTEEPIALDEFRAETLLRWLHERERKNVEQRRGNCDRALLRDRDREPEHRLSLALECHELAAARAALSAGASPHHTWGGADDAPLVHSARSHPQALALLLDAGASLYERDRAGNTLLHTAARHGERATLMRLAEDEALVNTAAYDGATALHRALAEPRYPPQVLAPLVLAQRDIDARNIDGESALHLALHSPAVVLQLLAAGADPDARDERDRTPLHRAAAMWLGEGSIRALLAVGADESLRDARGRRALDIARELQLPHNEALLSGEKAP